MNLMLDLESSERLASADEGYVVQATGLVLLRELTEEEWVTIGPKLRTRAEGSTWALGDWLVYGGGRDSRHRVGRRWSGSQYDRAAELTGYSISHLNMLFITATEYPADYPTRGIVSWRAHKEALRVKPEMRGEILQMAREKNWASIDVQRHIDAILTPDMQSERSKRLGDGVVRKRHYQPIRVKCPACAHIFPVKGHKATLREVV